ncbi:MAG: hypothetical protein IT323_06515 [Anaerolineae bacterium]|nr:hypothetical protein [Anaerolineae bacterium]
MLGTVRRALRRAFTIAAAGLIGLAGLPGHAQTPACPDMVKQALLNTGQNCAQMGRDQLCYGYDRIDIALRPDVAPGSVAFQSPGDVIDMAVVDTIRPAALDSATGEWGVAFLRTRANLADVAAGQFVTFMLFGDVELQQASTSAPDGVQAYYFRTGVGGSGDATCQNTPANGILIQTPKGAGQVQLVMNEVRLSIGSTVFLTTTPTSLPRGPIALQATRTPTKGAGATGQRPTLRVRTFEGHAIVQSKGRSELVIARNQIDVPLDEDYLADGEPGEPEFFEEEIVLGFEEFLEDASEGDLFEDRDPIFDEESLADDDLSEWDTADWNWDEWDWDDDADWDWSEWEDYQGEDDGLDEDAPDDGTGDGLDDGAEDSADDGAGDGFDDETDDGADDGAYMEGEAGDDLASEELGDGDPGSEDPGEWESGEGEGEGEGG